MCEKVSNKNNEVNGAAHGDKSNAAARGRENENIVFIHEQLRTIPAKQFIVYISDESYDKFQYGEQIYINNDTIRVLKFGDTTMKVIVYMMNNIIGFSYTTELRQKDNNRGGNNE